MPRDASRDGSRTDRRRGRGRTILAVVVLAVWLGTMGWYAERLYLKPEAERLAAGARTLPPGVAYYAVFDGERQIGWAQSTLDTLPDGGGFLVRDRLELELGVFGLPGRADLRSRARLGPGLDLRSFSIEARGLMGGLSAQGAVEGDTALVVAVGRGGTVQVRRIPLAGQVVPTTALPLRLAAEGESRPGDRYRIRTFDPTSMARTTRVVEIEERALRTYPDSAVRRGGGGPWRPGRRDTVLAWRTSRELAGRRLDVWIDSHGRYLELRTPGGFRLQRTAYELAYYGARGRPVVHGGVEPLEDEGEEEGGGAR